MPGTSHERYVVSAINIKLFEFSSFCVNLNVKSFKDPCPVEYGYGKPPKRGPFPTTQPWGLQRFLLEPFPGGGLPPAAPGASSFLRATLS